MPEIVKEFVLRQFRGGPVKKTTLYDKFLVDRGPIVVTDFLKVFFSHFFIFLPVPLTLASLNGAGWIFPVNFNYQRCLENSDMINFWLKSWVILWWLFSYSFLVCHFLPRTRVCNKQLLINTRPKYYYDISVTFLGTRGKNRLTSDPWSEQAVPPFLLMENSLRRIHFSGDIRAPHLPRGPTNCSWYDALFTALHFTGFFHVSEYFVPVSLEHEEAGHHDRLLHLQLQLGHLHEGVSVPGLESRMSGCQL